jgi:hypothetical protein
MGLRVVFPRMIRRVPVTTSKSLRETREFLSHMLGVRRVSVTEVLRPLQERGPRRRAAEENGEDSATDGHPEAQSRVAHTERARRNARARVPRVTKKIQGSVAKIASSPCMVIGLTRW